MSEEYTEPRYLGWIELPSYRCRVRFKPVKREQDIPMWAFSLMLMVLAVLIGLCGSLLLIPYGGICR